METKFTAFLVDDEPEAIDYLSILIKENCPDIEVIATAASAASAIPKIFRSHPDLLFLDIQMDDMNGFELVEVLQKENHLPHVIFVTAYDNYAIDAFKANAMDYLLKPVDRGELKRVVSKFTDIRKKELAVETIQKILRDMPTRIRFNTRTGYILLNPEEIVYCQADGNYCDIFLNDNTQKVVSCNLGTLMDLLPEGIFKRISRFHVINERFLTEVDRGKHLCVLKNEKKEITLSYSSKLFGD